MHPDCNPELLEERKWERDKLPIQSCAECLFNVLCTDYIIHESEEKNQKEEKEGTA